MAKAERYEIKDPSKPATKGQTYALYSVCGVDVRELGLTKGNASELIDAAKNGQSRHTRVALIDAGGIQRTRDVHKNYRSDPKPKGYKIAAAPKSKGNGKSEKSNEELLMELVKSNPELLKTALAKLAGEKPKAKPKPKTPKKVEVKPKAKPKAKVPAKVSEEPDEDENDSDDDLLSKLTAAIQAAG